MLCQLFHHPDQGITLEQIVEKRLGFEFDSRPDQPNNQKNLWNAAIALFDYLRNEIVLQKNPSTAELLNWIQLSEETRRLPSANAT